MTSEWIEQQLVKEVHLAIIQQPYKNGRAAIYRKWYWDLASIKGMSKIYEFMQQFDHLLEVEEEKE